MVRSSESNEVNGSRAARKKPEWYYQTAKYAKPSLSKALFQILDTIVPYFVLLALIIVLVKAGWSAWLTLPLSIVAALFFGAHLHYFSRLLSSFLFCQPPGQHNPRHVLRVF